MHVALTRAVPPSILRCELTHVQRAPIDVHRAAAQHRRYEKALEAMGCTVRRLPATPDLPDSVFVEDVAVVLPEVAVVTRPGAASRRAETASAAEALAAYRPLARIQAPGTMDGGDVLRVGRRIVVGRSARTNADGIRQLRAIASAYGYEVAAVSVAGCLHLKTAVTQVSDGAVLLNPAWIDADVFAAMDRIDVHPDEPFAANALRVGDAVLFPAAFPRTRERLEARGIAVRTVDADELAKAEAGLTCCSIIVSHEPREGKG